MNIKSINYFIYFFGALGLGKYERGMFVSRSTIQRYNCNLSSAVDKVIPSKLSPDHSMFKLDLHAVFRELIAVNNFQSRGFPEIPPLDADGRRSSVIKAIKIDGTIDGGKMTEHKGMLITALKLTDSDMLTNLFQNKKKSNNVSTTTDDTTTEENWHNVQSTKSIFLMGFCVGKDNLRNNYL
jgi:hypothetical protein